MKATNNLNQDLKEEIEEINQKCSKLQIFYDD
jgi:cell shape-determining protein MreC